MSVGLRAPVSSNPCAACQRSIAEVVALVNWSSIVMPPNPRSVSDCSSWRTSGPSLTPDCRVRHIGRVPTIKNALGDPSISTSD